MFGCADVLPIKLAWLICPDAVLSEPVCSPLCSRSLCARTVSAESDARRSNGPLWVPYLALSLRDSIKWYLFIYFSSPGAFTQPAPSWQRVALRPSRPLLVWCQPVGLTPPLYLSEEGKKNWSLLHSSSSLFSFLSISWREAACSLGDSCADLITGGQQA